jgi:UDP:flavonoid glycosyltransferase YjiC (YdhE family)
MRKHMRIVIIATGSWGDVRPNAALAHGLKQAGYEVTVIATEEFRTWVEQRGVSFTGLSVDIRAMLDTHANSSNPIQTMRSIRAMTQATVQMGSEIANVIQARDAVLLSEGLLPLVHGALEKHRVRHMHVNLQPWVPTSEFVGMAPAKPPWMPVPEARYNRLIGSMVQRGQWWAMGGMGNQVRTRDLGLPRQTWVKYRALLDETPSILLVSPHVLPRPTDWSPHHRVTGYIFDDDRTWEAPPELLAFLAQGDRPVYIGFGSMRERQPEQTTRLLLDAVQRTGKRAILLRGWAGIGGWQLPKHVFLLNYAPHNWLFPHVSAVVHHGGAGTTAAALRAGVPSVVIPALSDQPFWGRRLYELGVGAKPIPRNKLTADTLATAINTATTTHTIQVKTAQLARKIAAEDGVGEAVRIIRQWAH